jgi:DNA repair exonuclease SbcCD ATPase subunit
MDEEIYNLCYSYAWEMGHSSGYDEVANYMYDLDDLAEKIIEIESVKEELKNSSIEEANNIQKQIEQAKKQLEIINMDISQRNKEISHINSTKAVIQYNINQSTKNALKQKDLKDNLVKQENALKIYQHVIQAFSAVGIPNLIIQNVLDDLQIEANNLLSQLKPGLQLSFVIEKTKGDGTQDDTLEINYLMNGKPRDYEQLSGAMKLSVIFSLKLGLSFLLQKMIGTDIKFLLLDEIDQPLDKASVDAFADIVKFFQKDFKILVITHNDRLKDKFSHAILVDQDINMVSKAQVVSSW